MITKLSILEQFIQFFVNEAYKLYWNIAGTRFALFLKTPGLGCRISSMKWIIGGRGEGREGRREGVLTMIN